MNPTNPSIDQLLDAYYRGETTPEEEMDLLILLVENKQDPRYAADCKLLLGALAGVLPTSDSTPAAPQARPRWRFLSRRAGYSVAAAACLLFFGVGIYRLSLPSSEFGPITGPEISYCNGENLSQEEVDRYAQKALYQLVQFVDSHSECEDKVSEAFSILQRSAEMDTSSSSGEFIPVSQ